MSDVSGNKTSPIYGGSDLWVVRLADDGTILWDRTFGGALDATVPSIPANDGLSAITSTADGGFLLVGSSYNSTGGSKTATGYGRWDAYLVKIDSNGNLVWDKTIGTPNSESLDGICETADGGYAFVGTYDQFVGNFDVWVIKTDSAGVVEWQQTYGGSGDDVGVSIVQRSDGGYIVAADSASEPSAGRKTSPYYGGAYYMGDAAGDYWILWLDSDGKKQAEQSFGGEYDETVADVSLTSDGGILVTGTSLSPASGNKTSAGIGYTDVWVVRLDSSGKTLWDRSYGSPWWDYARSVRTFDDDGFLLGGQTNANPWLVRCDKYGAPLWQYSDGLAPMDTVVSMDMAADGSLFFAGGDWSDSSGFGSLDFVAVRTSPEPPVLSLLSNSKASGGFVLNVFSAPGTCVSEWSSNALEWMPFSTNVSIGKVYQVTDPTAAGTSRRFYRVGRH